MLAEGWAQDVTAVTWSQYIVARPQELRSLIFGNRRVSPPSSAKIDLHVVISVSSAGLG